MLPEESEAAGSAYSHVGRSEDHGSNTALTLQMFAALGAAPPAFAHEALLTGSEGKLSKRLGSLGVDAFREAGIAPEAVRALLARIGTSDPVAPIADAGTLTESFAFACFRRPPARFPDEALRARNAAILPPMPY